MESILTDFETGMKPDLVIVNSCVLVVWNMTMPLGKKIVGGFLVPEIQHMGPTLRFDVIEANYFGATLADEYSFDVLDFHFQFRFSLQHRMQDGVHWNAVAHRQITCLLLEHVAQAWGVELPDPGEKCRLKNDANLKPSVVYTVYNLQHFFCVTFNNSKHAFLTGPLHGNERGFNPPMMPAVHYNNGNKPLLRKCT
uniref:Family with sequence similarity 113 n=1 Tax=Cyprinus carpio TaxID=7962 RepID=A0A8C1QGV2_CYPCA